MAEFALPYSPADTEDSREDRAPGAGNLRIVAFGGQTTAIAALVMISGASLGPAPAARKTHGLVDASTLFATQVLQLAIQAMDEAHASDRRHQT